MTTEAFTVGRLVQVEARTWPGINKHGGVGRIIRRTETSVDVQYVLGGRERGIPCQYVSIVEDLSSGSKLRDRSILLGRCRNCGSLRADCGSCDIRQHEEPHVPTTANEKIRLIKEPHVGKSDEEEDSSSDDSMLLLIRERKRQQHLGSVTEDRDTQVRDERDCESDSSDDDLFLAAFQKTSRLRRNLSYLNRFERETAPKAPKRPLAKATKLSTGISQYKRTRNRSRDKQFSRHDSEGIGDVHMTLASSQSNDDVDVMEDFATIHEYRQSPATSARLPSPFQEGELLMENDLDGFIQPEGVATRAPQDYEDKTLNLAFGELPDFFEKTLNRVNEALPKAQVAFQDISRRVDIRMAVNGDLSDLEEEGWRLYDSAKETLLLAGLDQCRYLFGRLNSRKELKKHETIFSNRQKRQFGESARNRRDILFDQTEKDVEDFLRALRHYLLYDLGSTLDDEVFGDICSEESLPDEENCPSSPSKEDTEWGGNRPKLAKFDPHMHASRTARTERSIRTNRAAKRRRNPRQDSLNPAESAFHGGRNMDHSKTSRPRVAPRVARSAKTSSGNDFGRNDKALKGGPQKSSESRLRPKLGESSCGSDADDESIFFESNEGTTPGGPCLERLLETSSIRTQKLSTTRQQTERRANNKIAVVDRMPHDANSSHVETWLKPFLNKTAQTHPPHCNQRTYEKSHVDSRSSMVTRISTSRIPPSDNEIFHSLSMSALTQSNVEGARDVTLLAGSVRVLRSRCQPLTYEHNLLDVILQEMQSEEFVTSRQSVVSVFAVAHAYLIKNTESLQELVATDNPRLSDHLEVLVAVLVLFAMNLQDQLQVDDGLLFSLFSGKQPCVFVEMLIMQLLDVLFAFFNPKAWAMNVSARKVDVVKCFAPLANALSSFVPLFEISCQYILNRMECQQWYQSQNSSKWFVSALDPKIYGEFLTTAEMPRPVNVRLKQFKSKIPRIEVNALWSTIGFLASTGVATPAPTSKSRWRLLYTIMCCETGVLPKSLECCERSRPCEAHVMRCEIELGYLTALVDRGAMLPLEFTDKIVGTLLKRSIQLQARLPRKKDWFSHLFPQNHVPVTRESALFQWEASASKPNSAITLPHPFSQDKFFLLSGLLQKGIDLVTSWTRQTKANPVLWTQFAVSINKLQELQQDWSDAKKDVDQFERAFANNERDEIAFVREAAAAVVAAFDVVRSEVSSTTKKAYISRKVVSKTWSCLSSAAMKSQHELLLGRTDPGDTVEESAAPQTLHFSAIRIFSVYLYTHLGATSAIRDIGTESNVPSRVPRIPATTHQYLLHEAFSYIFVSLDCMCASISKSRARDSAEHIKALCLVCTWICQIIGTCRQLLDDDENHVLGPLQSEIHAVGRSIVNLGAKALQNCLLTILRAENCDGKDTCFRLCIAAIRNMASWAAHVRAKDMLQRECDEFGNVDDFMLLDIEPCTAKAKPSSEILCNTMMRLLEIADPSRVYCVNRNVSFVHEFGPLDSHSRILLSRFAGGLCACLATFLAAGHLCDLTAAIKVNVFAHSGVNSFGRNVAFTLLAEICKLAETYTPCKTFLEKNCEAAVIAFLDMVLDADSLERFPICDQQIMLNLTGYQGARRERKQLNLMHGANGSVGVRKGEEIDEVGPVYVSGHLWKFFRDLRNVLDLRMSCKPLFHQLASIKNETVFGANDNIHKFSMEMECLRRMKFLLSFFSTDLSAEIQRIVEDSLLFAIKSAMMNLLTISDGLAYHKLKCSRLVTSDEPMCLTYKHGRLHVLQNCYVEVFIGVICSVVLPNWNNFSESFKSVVSNVREVLFFSSSYEDIDVDGCFRRFLDRPHRSDSTGQRTDASMLDLRRRVKYACIRRSSEIIRNHLRKATPTDRQRGVIAAVARVVALVNEPSISRDYVVGILAEGFKTKPSSAILRSPGHPLFEDYVDEIFINKKAVTTSDEAESSNSLEDDGIQSLRWFALTKVIPPRLRNRCQVNDSANAALADLANRLLYMELDDFGMSVGITVERAVELQELLNSCWDVLCRSLFRDLISADISSFALRCVSQVMALPMKCTDGQQAQSLLGWSRLFTKQSLDRDDNAAAKSKVELFACYLSTYACLAFHISTSLLGDPNSAGAIKIAQILRSVDVQGADLVNIATPSPGAVTIESLARQLQGLNFVLYSDYKEGATIYKNVYSKKSTMKDIDADVASVNEVSPEVKREAANLKAIIDAVPPL